MLTLILVLLVILFIVFRVIAYIVDSDSYYCFSIVTCVFIILLLIPICFLWIKVSTENMYDEKIAMYQEENATIEQRIDQIVQEYMEQEQDTFAELKTDESPITLVNLFPELKSDTLVQQQIEIYVANSAKIKNLKEEKINLGTAKWLLYFGT